jgi:hypothetical protein
METEQHTAERPVGNQRNKEINKKVPREQSKNHAKGKVYKVYRYKCLHLKNRNLSNKQHNDAL